MQLRAMFGLWAFTGCYTQADVAHEVNAGWRGHAAVEVQAHLGPPNHTVPVADGTTHLRWTAKSKSVTLPSGHLHVDLSPTSFAVDAAVRPGTVEEVEYDVASAVVDPRGTILALDAGFAVGGMLGGNRRTGIVFGLHGGVSSLDDARSPLPGLGLYIGGMLGPRHALIGTYSFANGRAADDSCVHGHAWGLALQYWPLERLALHAGPAMVLDTDPMPDSATIAPGAVGAVSYAVVRAGSFVLDLRVDATVSTAGAFGVFGVGVNVN